MLTIDHGQTLKLNGATINGGIINNYDSTAGGTIEVFNSSTIGGNGGPLFPEPGWLTIDAHQTLTLDDVTVTGTAFTDTATGAVLQVDDGDTLTLAGTDTISGGAINLNGATAATELEIAGAVTLDSGATLTLTDNAENTIRSTPALR